MADVKARLCAAGQGADTNRCMVYTQAALAIPQPERTADGVAWPHIVCDYLPVVGQHVQQKIAGLRTLCVDLEKSLKKVRVDEFSE